MKQQRSGLTHIGDLLADVLPTEAPVSVEQKPESSRTSISKRTTRRVDRILAIRDDREQHTQKLGYLARPFILCGLPFKPKKGVHVYRRQNGNEVLEIHGSPEYGLPFGGDIQVLVWVSTLAVLGMKDNGGNVPRVIEFHSGADFLRAFGLPLDGRTYKRAQERFLRIFYSTFYYGSKSSTKRVKMFRVHFFDEIDLWFTRDLETRTLPSDDFKNNRVVLSEAFADDLERHHPPIELSAVAAWSDKPAQLYFYLWLVFRCYLARGASEIPLIGPGSVYEQCGVEGYKGDRGPRNFRGKVNKWLEGVKLAWPECPAHLVTSDHERGDYLLLQGKALAIHPRIPR